MRKKAVKEIFEIRDRVFYFPILHLLHYFIFFTKSNLIRSGNRVTGLVPVPNFCYLDPKPVSTGS